MVSLLLGIAARKNHNVVRFFRKKQKRSLYEYQKMDR